MYCELNSFFTTVGTHFSVLGSHFQKSSRSEHIGSLFGLNCGLLLIALATFKVVVSHLDTTSAKTLFAHLHTLSKLLNLSSKLKLNTKINKMAISCIFFYSNTTLKYILNLKNEMLSKQFDRAEHLHRCFGAIHTERVFAVQNVRRGSVEQKDSRKKHAL